VLELGVVHKRRLQSGEFSQCGQGGEGVLQMRTSALLGAKNLGFFEIYGMSVRTRVEGVNFSWFWADVFLWTAP